jgi:hypothetical protein
MFSFKFTVFLLLFSLLTIGCDDEKVNISIISPPRGSMLAGGEEVTVELKAGGKTIHINGEEISGTSVVLDPIDGMGFIKAEIPGEDLFSVVSYHQGEYLSPSEFHSGTMKISMGANTIGSTDFSIATLISDILTNEELESYVDNPLHMDVELPLVGTVPATVLVTSVISPSVTVTMTKDGSYITFYTLLTDVDIDYTATATGMNSSGTAFYETIEITSNLQLTIDGINLTETVATTSECIITDSGGLPASAVENLADLFNDEISSAVATATENAAADVFSHLLSELKPNVGIEFEKPITSSSALSSADLGANGIELSYESKLTATTPLIAATEHKVMMRSEPLFGSNENMVITFGSRLINQYSFSVWDAGNMTGLRFTKSELQDMGMEELDFPYSNLNHADISLLLPPLLYWDQTGPWMQIGGIQIDLSVTGASDSTAWTAALIPVKLTENNGKVTLEIDDSRTSTIMDVGFDRISALADQGKILKLLNSAVPGVIKTVFSTLPALTIGSMQFSRLDGSQGPNVLPVIDSMEVESSGWKLNITLTESTK